MLQYFRDYKRKRVIIFVLLKQDDKRYRPILKKLPYVNAGGGRWFTELTNYDRFLQDINSIPGATCTKSETECIQDFNSFLDAKKGSTTEVSTTEIENIPSVDCDSVPDKEDIERNISIEVEQTKCKENDLLTAEIKRMDREYQTKCKENDLLTAEIKRMDREYNQEYQTKCKEIEHLVGEMDRLTAELTTRTKDLEVGWSDKYEQKCIELEQLREELEQRNQKKPTIQEEQLLIQPPRYQKSSYASKIDYYKQLGKKHLAEVDDPSSSESEEDDHYMERIQRRPKKSKEEVEQLRRKIQELEVRRR